MTDRVHALTVVLEKDMRIDDCVHLMKAIRMMRHVQQVDPHVSDTTLHVATSRVRREFFTKLMELLETL
jgi:hypothetical protein